MSKAENTALTLDIMGCIDSLDKAKSIIYTLQTITAEINDLSLLPTDNARLNRVCAYEVTQAHLMEFLESTIQDINDALKAIAKATA